MDVHCYENETVRIEWHTKLYISILFILHAHKHILMRTTKQLQQRRRRRRRQQRKHGLFIRYVKASIRAGYVIKIPFLLCLDMTI